MDATKFQWTPKPEIIMSAMVGIACCFTLEAMSRDVEEAADQIDTDIDDETRYAVLREAAISHWAIEIDQMIRQELICAGCPDEELDAHVQFLIQVSKDEIAA